MYVGMINLEICRLDVESQRKVRRSDPLVYIRLAKGRFLRVAFVCPSLRSQLYADTSDSDPRRPLAMGQGKISDRGYFQYF